MLSWVEFELKERYRKNDVTVLCQRSFVLAFLPKFFDVSPLRVEMRTQVAYLVATMLLGLSMDSVADISDIAAESDYAESREVTPTRDSNETPDENEDIHEELSSALTEVFTNLGEAVGGLGEAFNQQADEGSAINYLSRELASQFESIFERYDTDENGGLSMDELEKVTEDDMSYEYRILEPDARRAKRAEEFKELDKNEDGKVSLEEATVQMRKLADAIRSAIDNQDSGNVGEQGATDSNESEDGGHSD